MSLKIPQLEDRVFGFATRVRGRPSARNARLPRACSGWSRHAAKHAGTRQRGSTSVACIVYPASPTPIWWAWVLITPVTVTVSNSDFSG